MTKLPVLDVRTSANTPGEIDILLIAQDSGGKPLAVNGPYAKILGQFRKGDAFKAASGSIQFVRFGGKGSRDHAAFVGIGSPKDLTEEKVRTAAGHLWQKLKSEKVRTAVIHMDALVEARSSEGDAIRFARAFAEGFVLGCYQFDKYKIKSPSADYTGPTKIGFFSKDKVLNSQLKAQLTYALAALEAMNVTRDWSNEPSNIGTPEYYAAQAKVLAKEYGLTCRVLSEKDAEREKMGLFLGVGQGSEREGQIVIVEYNPKPVVKGGKPPKTIAFVGKGVTFDTGGISIKPSMRMEDMKHDMTGAATVMGATILASLIKAPNRIVTIMGFTENMPGGNAITPGHVIKSRSGKTVEIINTDAEGRLILADLLDYAQDLKPDAMIDAATLTGAVSIALGKQCCAILGNDDSLIESVRRAGDVAGERIWQLPLFDEYFEDMKSDYADMKNSCNDSYGGTIRGAIFLKQYIRKGTRWAHLDIAATANSVSHHSYIPKRGATGTYVRTLAQFAAEF